MQHPVQAKINNNFGDMFNVEQLCIITLVQSIPTLVQGMVPALVISAPVRSPAILGARPSVRGYSLSVLTSNTFYVQTSYFITRRATK